MLGFSITARPVPPPRLAPGTSPRSVRVLFRCRVGVIIRTANAATAQFVDTLGTRPPELDIEPLVFDLSPARAPAVAIATRWRWPPGALGAAARGSSRDAVHPLPSERADAPRAVVADALDHGARRPRRSRATRGFSACRDPVDQRRLPLSARIPRRAPRARLRAADADRAVVGLHHAAVPARWSTCRPRLAAHVPQLPRMLSKDTPSPPWPPARPARQGRPSRAAESSLQVADLERGRPHVIAGSLNVSGACAFGSTRRGVTGRLAAPSQRGVRTGSRRAGVERRRHSRIDVSRWQRAALASASQAGAVGWPGSW